MMCLLMCTCVRLLLTVTLHTSGCFLSWHLTRLLKALWCYFWLIFCWRYNLSWILLTLRCRRVECACAQTLLGILITMLGSRGATELLELSGLLFQGTTHYITIPEIRLLQGVQEATEEEELFLTPWAPFCLCKPTTPRSEVSGG